MKNMALPRWILAIFIAACSSQTPSKLRTKVPEIVNPGPFLDWLVTDIAPAHRELNAPEEVRIRYIAAAPNGAPWIERVVGQKGRVIHTLVRISDLGAGRYQLILDGLPCDRLPSPPSTGWFVTLGDGGTVIRSEAMPTL